MMTTGDEFERGMVSKAGTHFSALGIDRDAFSLLRANTVHTGNAEKCYHDKVSSHQSPASTPNSHSRKFCKRCRP